MGMQQSGYRWQAPTVPEKNLLCCNMLRHDAAGCTMLQAVGGGYPDLPKTAKVANPRTKNKGMHFLTPCKDEDNRIISWVVMLLLLLLTFPLFVHFIDIHDCQMPQNLSTHIETIMC